MNEGPVMKIYTSMVEIWKCSTGEVSQWQSHYLIQGCEAPELSSRSSLRDAKAKLTTLYRIVNEKMQFQILDFISF